MKIVEQRILRKSKKVKSSKLDEKKFWEQKDPIQKLSNYLINQNIASQTELDTIQEKVKIMIDDAVECAENSPDPKTNELYRYVFTQD